MRIFITGSRGFIGRHLTAELSGAGHAVTGFDRQDGDLAKSGVFSSAIDTGPELVVHLAAQVGRLRGEDDIIHTIRSNAQMTMLVAHACGKHRIPVLYASSSEIYGDQGDTIVTEDTPPALPYNLYGLSKRWGEEVLTLYAPVGLAIARLSMPYGPGAPPGRGRRAMDNFLWQAWHRMPITVHHGAVRSWCHVSDTCRALRLIIEQGAAGAYNVGRSDRLMSMLELAVKACELTGCPTSMIHEVAPPTDQIVIKNLSTDRIKALGWRPYVELDQGMREVLEWVKQFDADGHRMEAVR